MEYTTHGPMGPNATTVTATVQIEIDLDVWEGAYGKSESPTEVAESAQGYLGQLIASDFESRGLTTTVQISGSTGG